MKKLLATILILLSGLVFVPTVYGQEYQILNRQKHGKHRQVIVVQEYRYVRVGRIVYKETYRSVYRKGRLVRRVLVSRERLRRFEHYRSPVYKYNAFYRY